MFFFLQNYNINQLFLLTSESMTVRSYGGSLGAQLDHTLEAHFNQSINQSRLFHHKDIGIK